MKPQGLPWQAFPTGQVRVENAPGDTPCVADTEPHLTAPLRPQVTQMAKECLLLPTKAHWVEGQ